MNQSVLQAIIQKGHWEEGHWEDGVMLSVDPPETAFGYTYHAHMIPPLCPKDMLLLGSGKVLGNSTVQKLIEKVFGKIESVVEIDLQNGIDAKSYVEESRDKFDYIAVDLWCGSRMCDFVKDKNFASKLFEMCNGFICLNVPYSCIKTIANVYTEAGFNYDRFDQVEGNGIIWFSK